MKISYTLRASSYIYGQRKTFFILETLCKLWKPIFFLGFRLVFIQKFSKDKGNVFAIMGNKEFIIFFSEHFYCIDIFFKLLYNARIFTHRKMFKFYNLSSIIKLRTKILDFNASFYTDDL